ncbi:protein of unknown function [Microbacterium sp. Nx66]|nr:protein of unknown function [Microbacterium sp. Nx66]
MVEHPVTKDTAALQPLLNGAMKPGIESAIATTAAKRRT